MRSILIAMLIIFMLSILTPISANEGQKIRFISLSGKYGITSDGNMYDLLGKSETEPDKELLIKTDKTNVRDYTYVESFLYDDWYPIKYPYFNDAVLLSDGVVEGYAVSSQKDKVKIRFDEVKAMAVYGTNTAVIRKDGTVWIWGEYQNNYNKHTKIFYDKPTIITGIEDAISVTTGRYTVNIVRSNGEIWKYIFEGANASTMTLERDERIDNVLFARHKMNVDVRYGKFFYAVKKDGTVWLPDTKGYKMVPNLIDIVKLDADFVPAFRTEHRDSTKASAYIAQSYGSHWVALKSDGTVWEWGYLEETGTPDKLTDNIIPYYTDVPMQVIGLKDIIDVSAVGEWIIALKKDGTIVKCGRNAMGGLETTNRYPIENRFYYITMNTSRDIMNINRSKVEIDPGRGTKPVLKNDRTLIPIRALIEALGGTVEWDDSNNQINMQLWNKNITMQIGNTEAIIDNKTLTMDVAPEVINDRTMVPLRFVAEGIGFGIEYIEGKHDGTVKLTYREVVPLTEN